MALLLTSCANLQENRSKATQKLKKEIIIGVTWPLQKKQLLFQEGLQMAAEEINNTGGVLGKKITLQYKDDENNPTKATLIALNFANDPKVTAVIGPYNSYIASQIIPIYENAGLILFSPAALLTNLTDQGYQYFFRNIPNDFAMGTYLGNYVYKKGYKRILVYYEKNTYSKELVNTFEDKAASLAIRVVYREPFESETPLSYENTLSMWSNYKFDAILLISNSLQDAEIILTEIKKHHFNKPIISSYGLDMPNKFQYHPIFNNLYIATAYSYLDKNLISHTFAKNFEEKYHNKPTYYSALAYDALKLIAYAITKTGSNDPIKVAQTIKSIKNWPGITGSHTFNDQGDVVNKKIIMGIVNKQKFQIIED
jgi:branched-chain amino acid transport system substrate-binding protein